jgi:lipopolysaccharide transport system ATP-binding protein
MTTLEDCAIRADAVSKVYRLYDTPADMFWELVTRRPRHRVFQALRDISFEMRRGEVVGIIGSNGAGKSTLLKILAGNLDLTAGSITMNGRVAAILELGSGFHVEMTGRENLYMSGLVAGMKREEIDRKLEGIIDFSGIREFIDQPVKTYSSGMQARLAFSLAISRDADILILDEALAAGDAIFANKCLLRIKEICESDTTVLFVSHATDVVRRFCARAIWLEQGRVVLDADADSVTKAYDRYVYEQSAKYLRSRTISASDLVKQASPAAVPSAEFFKYGSKDVRIVHVSTCGADGQPRSVFQTGDYVEVQIVHEGLLQKAGYVSHASIQLFSLHGDLVTSAGTRRLDRPFRMRERGVFKLILSPLLLGTGEYFISPYLGASNAAGEVYWLDFHDRLYSLHVRGRLDPAATQIIEHPFDWTYEALGDDVAATERASTSTEKSPA